MSVADRPVARPALGATLLTVACLFWAPAGAQAGTDYRVSVSGTLTSTGTVTDTSCEGEEPQAPAPPTSGPREADFTERPAPAPVTRTGTAKVTARFRTTRPAQVHIQRRSGGQYPAVTLVARPIQATATVEQSSDLSLDDRDAPRGCHGRPSASRPDCGTRTIRLNIGMGAHGAGLAPDLSKPPAPTVFERCPLTVGMAGFPALTGGHGSAPVSAAKLLAGRRMVLQGGRRGSDRLRERARTADGSYELRYTLTLVPARR